VLPHEKKLCYEENPEFTLKKKQKMIKMHDIQNVSKKVKMKLEIYATGTST